MTRAEDEQNDDASMGGGENSKENREAPVENGDACSVTALISNGHRQVMQCQSPFETKISVTNLDYVF